MPSRLACDVVTVVTIPEVCEEREEEPLESAESESFFPRLANLRIVHRVRHPIMLMGIALPT